MKTSERIRKRGLDPYLDPEANAKAFLYFAEDVALLEDVMKATNPWVASTAIQDQYQCRYCRALIHGHHLPDRDMMEWHEVDCVFLKALAKLEKK